MAEIGSLAYDAVCFLRRRTALRLGVGIIFVNQMLLMMAGDVERNPGPGKGGVREREREGGREECGREGRREGGAEREGGREGERKRGKVEWSECRKGILEVPHIPLLVQVISVFMILLMLWVLCTLPCTSGVLLACS